MSYLKINGNTFDVGVQITEYEEYFNVVDGENAGRVKSGRMVRDVLGAYFGHRITVSEQSGNHAGYMAFWNFIREHAIDDYVTLEAADGDTTISYQAYYTSGSRKLRYADDGTNYWGEITINFIPIAPQLTP